jgi:hypothetical protein
LGSVVSNDVAAQVHARGSSTFLRHSGALTIMRITPALLSLVVAAGVSATAATLMLPTDAAPGSPSGTAQTVVQEKTTGEKTKDAKKADKAEKITVWVLDAAGKG